LRSADERASRIRAAKAAGDKIEAERKEDARKTRAKEVKRKEVRASTSDPEARVMKCDGGFRPAYNVQIRTALTGCTIVGVDVTNCASDRGQLGPAVEDIERRYGRRPRQVLADGGYDSKSDIERLYGDQIEVFCPLPGSKGRAGDPTPKPGDGPGAIAWRKRMSSDEGICIYRKRFATERPHADMRNHGLTRLLVRGVEKVKAVVLWHVTAFNFRQRLFLKRMAQA
jgi:Transposase DDE domain